jgi:hypothetical protein
LDLSITVGPENPEDIKATLSGPLPILIDYRRIYKYKTTESAFWRMRSVLKHHRDRVREIAFEGKEVNFKEFFEMADCALPVLESLFLRSKYGERLKFPDTFLGDRIHQICIYGVLN